MIDFFHQILSFLDRFLIKPVPNLLLKLFSILRQIHLNSFLNLFFNTFHSPQSLSFYLFLQGSNFLLQNPIASRCNSRNSFPLIVPFPFSIDLCQIKRSFEQIVQINLWFYIPFAIMILSFHHDGIEFHWA